MKKNFEKYKIVFWVFISLCVLYILLFVIFRSKIESILENLGVGFTVSFSASFLEDLLFFSTLSAVVLFITNKNIKDYTFSEKISSIINENGLSDDQELEKYLEEEVFRRTVYDKQIDVLVTVTDYAEIDDEFAYKLFIETNFEIASMCKDHALRDLQTYWKVNASDIAVKDEIGHITKFEILTEGSPPVVIVPSDQQFRLDRLFERKENLRISKKTNIKVNLEYYSWSKTGEYNETDISIWNYIRCSRLTRKAFFRIKNQLVRPLDYKISTFIKEELEDNSILLQQEGTILPGRDISYESSRVMLPGEDFRIFFAKPIK